MCYKVSQKDYISNKNNDNYYLLSQQHRITVGVRDVNTVPWNWAVHCHTRQFYIGHLCARYQIKCLSYMISFIVQGNAVIKHKEAEAQRGLRATQLVHGGATI